jgi:hypothetical protein
MKYSTAHSASKSESSAIRSISNFAISSLSSLLDDWPSSSASFRDGKFSRELAWALKNWQGRDGNTSRTAREEVKVGLGLIDIIEVFHFVKRILNFEIWPRKA